ncbi:T9SS type A sorting domain-containing protein [bacterium]|nr:T9SS type A sorting domain-containing protein [bacterium]
MRSSNLISKRTKLPYSLSGSLILGLLLVSLSLSAQNLVAPRWQWIEETVKESPYKYSGVLLEGANNPEQAARNFLQKHYFQLADSRSDLSLVAIKESNVGYHITFSQTFMGHVIYGTEAKLNVLKEDNTISSSFVTLVNTKNWPEVVFGGNKQLPENAQPVIMYYNDIPRAAWLFETHNEAANEHYKVLLAEDGLSFRSDLRRSFTGGPRDTTVWVYVFDPDPLTTAGVVYGGPYINNYDKDTAVLTAERKLRQVPVRYQNDSIWAENEFVKLISEDVNLKIPYTFTDTFNYTRSQHQFEFIMALYHLTVFKNYLNHLGFDSLMNYQIKVRPRAFVDDNSNFQRTTGSGGRGLLRFGNSSKVFEHVDDAEDADVLIHEYGHAISYNANLNELDGAGRRAIDEGFCDYLAASYSYSINTFRAGYVYSWDGHNPFWDGRTTESTKTCNDFNANKTIYDNGEIFSSAVYEIHKTIGREITDRILINSLYSYADRMAFTHAGELFITTELQLFKGQYHDTICNIFKKYGFVDDDFCQSSVGEVVGNQQHVTIDQRAFAQNGRLAILFNQEFSGTVSIYNVNGQLLHTQWVKGITNFQQEINCAEGVYMVVLNDGKQLFTQKMVR